MVMIDRAKMKQELIKFLLDTGRWSDADMAEIGHRLETYQKTQSTNEGTSSD